jgi:hypothetical protein
MSQQSVKTGGCAKKMLVILFILVIAGGWTLFNTLMHSQSGQTPEASPGPVFDRKVLKIGIGSRPAGMLFHAVNHYIPGNSFKLEPVVIHDVQKRWALLAAGELDLNFSTLSEFVLAASRNNPGKLICFISSSDGCDGILVRPDTQTKENMNSSDSLNYLNGKNICVVPGSGEHFFLINVLNGIAVSTSEVSIIPAGRVSDVYAYFGEGNYLHAAVLTEPYLTLGKKAGYHQLVSSQTSYKVNEILTAGNFALTHRNDDIQTAVDAYFKLVNFIKDNPGLGKKLVSDRSGMSIEDIDLLFSAIKLKDIQEAKAPAKGSIVDAMQKIQQVWIIEGLPNAERKIDFDRIIDFSFMEKSSASQSSPIFGEASPVDTNSTEETDLHEIQNDTVQP